MGTTFCISPLCILTAKLLFILTQSQTQPSKICFIGDNLYGSVVKPFVSTQDPTTLMGTFTAITVSNTQSALSVDFNSAIYKHTNYKESVHVSNYIFKIANVGWVLTSNASPNTVTIEDDKIKLTCFEDDILDCLKYRWFSGYNSVQFPILPVGITSGKCNTNMCMDNFEMTIQTTNNNIMTVNKYILDGFMRSVSPTEPCTLDSSVCNSNRTYWINQDDPAYRWYYRATKHANWVYGQSGSEKIACAPGYVESPLFCNTFVYASDAAGGNYTNYTFTQGVCNPTASPTTLPTVSSQAPTRWLNTCIDPFNTSNSYYQQQGFSADCSFGSKGTADKYKCLTDGTFAMSKGCYLISFSDDFLSFNNEIWDVVQPYYVNGRIALAETPGNDLQFIPNNPALVNIIRSVDEIVYPLKLRSTLFSVENECNNWFIALGTSYAALANNSILLKYDCVTHEASLYNATAKQFNTKCWNDTTNNSLDVSITTTEDLVTVAFDAYNCSDLLIPASDIKAQDIKPYVWFGSFKEDNHNNNDGGIVGRFSNIFYTQFYTEFDGLNQAIWDKSYSPDIDDNGHGAIMFVGNKIIAGDSYEFEIPFIIKMGIVRPATQKGRYAHFIVLGDEHYMNERRDNVIQIVYDGYPQTRIVYSSFGVYVNSSARACEWNVAGKTFAVNIQIDRDIISIKDTFCADILYAKHDLNTSQISMAMGMIELDGDIYKKEIDFVTFKYMDIYQQPTVYLNKLLIEDEVENDLSATMNIGDIYDDKDELTFLGFTIYWIIAGVVLVILFCLYCLSAWCLNCFPFGKANKTTGDNIQNIEIIESPKDNDLVSMLDTKNVVTTSGYVDKEKNVSLARMLSIAKTQSAQRNINREEYHEEGFDDGMFVDCESESDELYDNNKQTNKTTDDGGTTTGGADDVDTQNEN